MQFLRAITAAVVAAVVRFFTPSIASIVADFERKIAKLNRLIDQANDDADACVTRRRELRAQIDATYAEQNAHTETAMRASAIRKNLEKIINA